MAGEPDSDPSMRGEDRVHPGRLGWPAIAGLAARQHGTAGRWQLLDLGFSAKAIDRLVGDERLHVLHRGVYAVGHRKLSRRGRRMAAVLSGGAGSCLSHRAAGSEWQLRWWDGRPSITAPTWRRSSSGLEVHCCSLPADEVTVLDGIPITTVPRTLLDLATILDPERLLGAVNEAEVRRLYVERGLPRPELNGSIHVGDGFYSPDCLWRAQRLIVELHSARYHGTTPAISRDATRDRRLLLAGWSVIHVTWAQLHSKLESDDLERDLRIALHLAAA